MALQIHSLESGMLMDAVELESPVDRVTRVRFERQRLVAPICTFDCRRYALFQANACYFHLIGQERLPLRSAGELHDIVLQDPNWKNWINDVADALYAGDGLRTVVFDDAVLAPHGNMRADAFCGMTLLKCSMVGTAFARLWLNQAVFEGCELAGTAFLSCSLINVTFLQRQMVATQFVGSDLSGSSLIEVKLDNVLIGGYSRCHGIDFTGSQFEHVRIEKTTKFEDADFADVSFANCNLMGVDWTGSRLKNVSIDAGSDLRGMKITKSQAARCVQIDGRRAIETAEAKGIIVQDDKIMAPVQGLALKDICSPRHTLALLAASTFPNIVLLSIFAGLAMQIVLSVLDIIVLPLWLSFLMAFSAIAALVAPAFWKEVRLTQLATQTDVE